ncbi:unnamed protein product [Linum trigynum]|uniref:Uncharacterized protein n=1 Tax=Linum trigynum TaxID=586398 RepID=A0AAV2GM59_9ROSI
MSTSAAGAPKILDVLRIVQSKKAMPVYSVPAKQGRRENGSAGTTDEESKLADGVDAILTTPEMSEYASIESTVPEFWVSNDAKIPLLVKQTADQDPLVGRAIQLKSSQIGDVDSLKDVPLSFKIVEFAATKPESEMPKSEFKILGL